MSDVTNEVHCTREHLQQLKEECKRAISLAESLERLRQNKDFKEVFIDFYTEKESIRLVKLLGDQSVNMGNNKEAFRNDIQERMIGISRFSEVMRQIYLMAEQADKTLLDIDYAKNEVNV